MQVQFRGEWMIRHCGTEGCAAGTLRVRRDPHQPDSWGVGEVAGRPTWREAATHPCCPQCGGDLVAATGRPPDHSVDGESRVA